MFPANEARAMASRADARYIMDLVEKCKQEILEEIIKTVQNDDLLHQTCVSVDYPIRGDDYDTYKIAANKRVVSEISDYFKAYGFKVTGRESYSTGQLTVSWPACYDWKASEILLEEVDQDGNPCAVEYKTLLQTTPQSTQSTSSELKQKLDLADGLATGLVATDSDEKTKLSLLTSFAAATAQKISLHQKRRVNEIVKHELKVMANVVAKQIEQEADSMKRGLIIELEVPNLASDVARLTINTFLKGLKEMEYQITILSVPTSTSPDIPAKCKIEFPTA